MAVRNTSVENEGFFLTTARFVIFQKKLAFLFSLHTCTIFMKRKLLLHHKGWHYLHLADFLARPLLGKLNRFVLGLPILCDGNHACLREARFAQKSQESGKNTLFCVVKVVSLKKSGQLSTYTSHDHSHQSQRWT